MIDIAWNLIKFNATKILCNLTERDIIKQDGNYKVAFKCDISGNSPIGRDIILSEDTFAENALFFQLRKVLEDSKLEVDENFMRSTLIFVDFQDIFFKKSSFIKLPANTPSKTKLLTDDALINRMEWLFEDGLQLSFDGENFKRFVPFDKSSSMARSCQITFIDSQIKDALDKRLMLDMDFIGRKLILSKFYAYLGLYLSAASRVKNAQKFPLNEETVIVLEDYIGKLKQITTFSASEQDGIYTYDKKEKTLRPKLFDGEGLISPDFAEYISNFLQDNYSYPKSSHSFQIRMPFTKGVLHEVDFQKFFAEYLPVKNGEWFIKDVFGITRDLRKAKIILTKSMFKCADWIKDYLNNLLDPMKYFFEKFAEYDHAIYVTNTEARLFNPGRVKLNYQFLSTLDLSTEDFNSLIADHHALIDSFATNFSALSDIQGLVDETCDDSEPNEIILRSSADRTTCLKTLKKNSAFLNDPKVKSIYEGMKKSYECDLGLGRLEVEGEQRFLSCDLLFLLIKILENVEGVKLDDAKIKDLKKNCLYQDRFFMPEGELSIKPDKPYVFLRNPHLSRNEQVLLRSYVKRKSLHEKYFSHLKGVVMVSAYSTAAMALGGADFDGDLVKVIPDKRIVQAVKKGNIDKKLPPIEIPSTGAERLPLGCKIPLRVILDTFSNKVGLISNWAVNLSAKEYSSESVEEYKDACAKCTIVVGLEIDAAKNGRHPEENIKELKELEKSCGKNIFLESKKIIEKILQGHYSPNVKRDKDTLVLRLFKDNKKPDLTVPIEKTSTPILERLPVRYLKLIEKPTVSKPTSTETLYFDFETPGWRKTLDESKRGELVKLIKAYCGVLNLNRDVQSKERSMRGKNFAGCVVNILKLQYDDYHYQKLSCGTELEVALNQLYAELSSWLKTSDKVREAIDALKNKKWHFTCEENRPRKAAEILGYEKLPPFFELLYNFRCNGYMLFYFVLKDLERILFDETDFISQTNADDNDFKFNQNPYYEELYQIYSKLVAEKKSKSIWKAQLIKICRQHLQELFSGDMSEALKYYWSLRSKDSSRNFLWNVFSEQEILNRIT